MLPIRFTANVLLACGLCCATSALAGTAVFVHRDDSTQGNWKNAYGNRFVLFNHATNLASTTRLTASGHSAGVWTNNTTHPGALMMVSANSSVTYGPLDRIASGLSAPGSFNLALDMSPPLARRVALYCLDWGGAGRSQQIELVDTNTGAIVDSRTVSDFAGGAYLVWDVTGAVRFRITRLKGPDAVLNAVFLDRPPFPNNTNIPSFWSNPVGLSVNTGEPLALGFSPVGEPPLSYQWLRNGAPVSGATQATFASNAARLAQAGAYQVVVGNAFGQATSAVAQVMVAGGAASLVCDLNDDGKNDLVFQSSAGGVQGWLMDGAGHPTTAQTIYPGSLADWRLVGVGRVNADRFVDLVFQSQTGAVLAWLMDGRGTPTSALQISSGAMPGWRIVALGDVNSDGVADLVWQSDGGALAAWLMNGQGMATNALSIFTGNLNNWKVVAMGDVNGDSIPDLLWQSTTGSVIAWLMNGHGQATASLDIYTASVPGWRLASAKDLNTDGIADLVWQSTGGSVTAWLMDGAGRPTQGLTIYGGALAGWLVY